MRGRIALEVKAIDIGTDADTKGGEACSDSDRAALGVFSRLAEKYRILENARELLERSEEPFNNFPVTEAEPGVFTSWNPIEGAKKPEDLDHPLQVVSYGIVFFALTLKMWRGSKEMVRLLNLLDGYDKKGFEIVVRVLSEKDSVNSLPVLIAISRVTYNGR